MDYFAVIFKNPNEDNIKISHKFVRIWGHDLKNPLKMKTSLGTKSMVYFKDVDKTLWLDRGWSSFAREYEPKHKDVVLFEYTGDSNFMVSFFKPCGMEKFTPQNPNVTFPAQFFKPFMKEEYFHQIKLNDVFSKWFGKELRNPVTIYCENGAAMKVQSKVEEGNIWLDKGSKDVVENCGIKMTNFLFFKYAGNSKIELTIVGNKEKPLCCTYKRHIDDAGHGSAINEQTLWFTKIKKSVHDAKQPLNIPSNIVREWFNSKPEDVEIMLPTGEKEHWTLLWYEPRPNQYLIGHGWYEFAKRTELQIGQHIRFYNRLNEAFLRIAFVRGTVVNYLLFR